METIEMNKVKKNLLIGQLVGSVLGLIIVVGFSFYLLFIIDFRWDIIKVAATESPELLVYISIPLLLTIVWIPKVLKLLKDIKQKIVVEGVGIIHKSSSSFSSGFDRYIVLDAFGKEKIKIQYKDRSVLGPQLKIKYRIAPASRLLTQFEVLTS